MSQTFNGESGGMITSLLPQQQQMVYGLDGTAYPSADAARAAGVFDFRYAPPMAPVPTAMPMAPVEGLPFNVPAARGSFNPLALRGSGLLSDVGAGSGLISGGSMSPSNVPMYGRTWSVPDYLAPASVQRSQAMGLMGNVGGGGSDYTDPNPEWTGMSDAAKAAYYAENPTMAAITRAGQTAFGYAFPAFAAAQEYMAPDFVRNQEMIAMGLNPDQSFEVNGGASGFNYGGDYDSFASERSSAGMGGAYEGSAGSTAATADMPDGPDGANASSKIVCTAMNHAYGFGGFRNKIWLAYAAKHLTKAHEVGYHTLFLPLVAIGYNQGDKMHNRIVRRVLENIARHRSADLRAEMRGTKRDPVGRVYRLILEPLCFAVGKLKGY
jgi:hypothetical protein